MKMPIDLGTAQLELARQLGVDEIRVDNARLSGTVVYMRVGEEWTSQSVRADEAKLASSDGRSAAQVLGEKLNDQATQMKRRRLDRDAQLLRAQVPPSLAPPNAPDGWDTMVDGMYRELAGTYGMPADAFETRSDESEEKKLTRFEALAAELEDL